MRNALYHFDAAQPPRTLLVLADNQDGTLELGRVDPADATKTILVVGKCPVSTDGKPGTAVDSDPKTVSKKPNK